MTFIQAVGYCFRHFNKHYRKDARWYCPDDCKRCRNFKCLSNKQCSCEWGSSCELNCAVPRVNLDYIDAVVADEIGKTVKRVQFPIEVPEKFLCELSMLLKSDNASWMDVQRITVEAYPDLPGRYVNFISPYDYDEKYLDPYEMFKSLTTTEYNELLQKRREELSKEYKDRYEMLIGHREVPREDDWIQGRLDAWQTKMKNRYFRRAVRSIACVHYNRTLKDAAAKYLSRLKLYSTDMIGDGRMGRDINERVYAVSPNLKIKIHTNFGYGTSADFGCILMYKEIPIVPYSMYVNYYFAKASDLCRFTRDYVPRSSNWHRLLDFVAEVVNLESQGEEVFEDRWIRQEVEVMMSGLEAIVRDPKSYFDKWAGKSSKVNTDVYRSVRAMNGRECEMYSCYEGEMILDFQAEKVSGAFDFLEALKQLESLANCVAPSISRIKQLGLQMQPLIVAGIGRVEADIKALEIKILRKKEELDLTEERLAVHKTAINNLCTRGVIGVQENEGSKKIIAAIVAEYRIKHPRYERLMILRDEIKHNIEKLQEDIENRKRFQERLMTFNERIVQHLPPQVRDNWTPLGF